jgi:hypothetical protein
MSNPNVTKHEIGDCIEIMGCRFVFIRIDVDGRGEARLLLQQVFAVTEVRVIAGDVR